ncbi:MAG TPA: type IV pilus assembly protein PilM [Candidatus Paceibacterota bacterium]|nr:type IV pilus assembly protein PilM [Candidatus Paceibacterota bacterium]
MAKPYLTVDIGTTSIKAAEILPGERPKILNYGILESSGYLARANQALQTSSLKIFESDVITLVKTLVKEMGTNAKDVYASLPLFSVFTTVLDFPQMEPKEIEKALIYQARQYVPLPLDEVALDWLKVSHYQDDKGYEHQKVLLISVPRSEIRRYQHIFASAGLSLRTLEMESLSLVRLFEDDPTPTMIIDIGSRSTNIIFMEKGSLTWNSQSDFASFSLTQALASSLRVNPLRAEELKKEKGIMGTGASYELSTIMLPFLDVILNEVKKSQFVYGEQVMGAGKPERAVLSGGGANLIGIDKYFEHELGIPVVRIAPFAKFDYAAEIEPFVPELGPIMGVALGLGMKPNQ